jgi:hypothetical protein
MGWSPDYRGTEGLGGVRPDKPIFQPTEDQLKPKPQEPNWKTLYAILHGGSSVALVALKAGDASSALAALEEAFKGIEQLASPVRVVTKPLPPPGPQNF